MGQLEMPGKGRKYESGRPVWVCFLEMPGQGKAEDPPTLMNMSPFANWSPFKTFMVIERICEGSRYVALKTHRELKSILSDETIEVTKLGSSNLMVELKSNNQVKKLGAIATFLDIPVTVSSHNA
ncbi:hypothetical protein PoB_002852100 [Plakobranchus ocellatus]|uniref:Uncharacterized protein n=1 Tax=Plakobranchus ocellatus TaxID=259542 RepID=A0AAV4A1I1_9GAST|nr:hypothetical protein PoB_002852100 [Plakobranchus ocellatus]